MESTGEVTYFIAWDRYPRKSMEKIGTGFRTRKSAKEPEQVLKELWQELLREYPNCEFAFTAFNRV